MTNGYLFDIATQALDAVVSRFAAEAVALPDRRYVTAGEVALDCDQVVVEIVRVFTGLPGGEITEPVSCAVPRSAEMNIWLIRCVPGMSEDGSAPSASALSDSGEELLTDGWILTWGLLQEYRDGNFLSQCDKLVIGNLTSVGPEGGFGGWALNIQADLTSWQR